MRNEMQGRDFCRLDQRQAGNPCFFLRGHAPDEVDACRRVSFLVGTL